jgi:hypothetical protein
MSGKKRPAAHVVGSQAELVLRTLLPPAWVLRPYHEDYGLDFALEVFDVRPGDDVVQTLGEHLFVQLKGTERIDWTTRTVYGRGNVERDPVSPQPDRSAELEVTAFSLDTATLATVDAMGAALPVMLILVDLNERAAYFVCLNDYLDKILWPEDAEWQEKGHRTILIPRRNRIADATTATMRPLRHYAQRAKLSAAFLKFDYQWHELAPRWANVDDLPAAWLAERFALAEHCIHRLRTLDVWEGPHYWQPLRYAVRAVEDVRAFFARWPHPRSAANLPVLPYVSQLVADDFFEPDDDVGRLQQTFQELTRTWEQLALLGRMYEELCREWYLPTVLGDLLSYD